ncbi:MAG: hypothetical protein GXP54_13065, partial [Deltaproteobacteria bacterium]|nr:hypothetical protein [Deltaproteobacteria bacterium]
TVGFATYNAGLAQGFVDYAPQRQPLIGPALAKLDADVICLDEVWNQDAVDAVIAGSKAVFPYSYYEITDSGEAAKEPSCTEDGTKALKDCVLAKCGSKAPSELGGCALDNCAVEFGQVQPKECVNCIAANIGLAEKAATVNEAIDAIIGACLESAGGGYAYEGRNGVMILSRHPLVSKEFLRFDSYLNVRVVLHAVAQVPQIGNVDVFCTHLTATLDKVPYNGGFETWAKEQAHQIDVMLPWIEDKEDPKTPTVLAGDMNCGPGKGAIPAELPENFAKFTAAGYLDPYATDPETPCTWCGDNPLVGGGSSMIIDHVMFRHQADSARFVSSRIMDQPVTLEVDGRQIESNYSDHYGAMVKMTMD